MDRAKDLIIRGGENISCAEVESAAYEHPGVAEACAFSLPDTSAAQLGEIVALAVVRKPESPTFTGAELVAFCSERLAQFKVPARVFLWNTELPRGATGKIPKRTVRSQIEEVRQRLARCGRC